jgi:hypothetical protein
MFANVIADYSQSRCNLWMRIKLFSKLKISSSGFGKTIFNRIILATGTRTISTLRRFQQETEQLFLDCQWWLISLLFGSLFQSCPKPFQG